MLQICCTGHDDLVHDGECPACAALIKVKETEDLYAVAQTQMDELKQELRDAEIALDQSRGEVSRLESKIDHLQAKLDNA